MDTNIFSLQLIPKPKPDHKPIQRQQAECFFEDIVNGRYQGIPSTITQVEFLGNTKRIISEVNQQKITPEQEDESMKTFDKFIESLGIGLVNADILIENSQLRTFENSIRIIRNTDPIDNRPYNCWKMIKSIDSTLLSIAEIINKKRSG